MTASTKDQLVSAAATLLDSGGQNAVTLRAVAELVDVSHNAPYRHFRDRSALLAAVAERDFVLLRQAFEDSGRARDAEKALHIASLALIGYARKHKARYRLLFSDPDLSPEPNLKDAAMASFQAFSLIVARCQGEGILPRVDPVAMTGLIYASLHGAIDLELGGRAGGTKGLGNIEASIGLLFRLLGNAVVSVR